MSITSGDVELFHRRFGRPGATPLLLLHGANYYDSADWEPVATALATDREVAAYDARGYGRSTWSPSRDYSLDAQLADVTAVLGHLGWPQAILVGHSRGGSFAVRYAHESPERIAGLVLVDYSPGQVHGRPRIEPVSVGPAGAAYRSIEEAHAATSRNPAELDTEAGRARVHEIFAERDEGWVNVQRDPAFASDRPDGVPGWVSALPPVDLWEALRATSERVPTLVVRALRSAAYDEAGLARLQDDLPRVRRVDVDSGHDVPGTAPAELVAAVRAFLD